MDLIELLAGGSFMGLLGNVLTQGLSIWRAADERKTLRVKHEHEIKLQEMQLASLQHETERELLITEHQTNAAALQAAYRHDADTGVASQIIVDIIKTMRPFITFMLIVLTAIIYFDTQDKQIQTIIVYAVVFSMLAAMSFWFGDRSISKNVMNHSKLPWK